MPAEPIVESGSHNHSSLGHCDCDLYHGPESHSTALQQQFENSHSDISGPDESSASSLVPESIIRGNMQYVDGQLKKIPRPLNAFMIFSNEKRKELKNEFPGEPNNLISSRLGAAWKALSDEKRKRYHDMAHREDLEHRRKYPNYQYCPGHARKLKKARKEQRKKQQQNNLKAGRLGVKQGKGRGGHTSTSSPSAYRKQQPAAKLFQREGKHSSNPSSSFHSHSINQPSAHPPHPKSDCSYLPGPHGEGHHVIPHPFTSAHHPPVDMTPVDCSLSCCSGCKPADCAYCCPESAGWNVDVLPSHSYPPSSFQQMMYFPSGGCDPHCAMESMHGHGQCMMPGDCSDCYASSGYMDACFTPGPGLRHSVYGAGEGPSMPAAYKDFCCGTPELAMAKPNNVATPAPAGSAMNDSSAELTDISNNNVVQSGATEPQNPASGKHVNASSATCQNMSTPNQIKKENC